MNKDTGGIKTYTFTEEERKRIEKDFNDGTLEALFEQTLKEDGSEFPNIKKESEDRNNKSKLMTNNTKKK